MISEERTEVVVVGGGISGLSAAAALQVRSILNCWIAPFWEEAQVFLKEAGVRVVLLEARQRLGGRICTVEVGQLQINFDQSDDNW